MRLSVVPAFLVAALTACGQGGNAANYQGPVPPASSPGSAAMPGGTTPPPKPENDITQHYVIGPQDVISIFVYNEPNFTSLGQTVRPDGIVSMPLVGEFYDRMGSTVASFQNARRLLEMGALVGLFPEGVEGVAKGIWQSYRLQRFHTGFVRLSLQLRIPIIPTAVVGAEEIYPVIGKWQRLGPLKEWLNIPYVPVTPLFPLFGAIGLVPLPTKWHLRFGAPLRFFEPSAASDRLQPKHVRTLAERVRRQIQTMVHELLAERESIF